MEPNGSGPHVNNTSILEAETNNPNFISNRIYPIFHPLVTKGHPSPHLHVGYKEKPIYKVKRRLFRKRMADISDVN